MNVAEPPPILAKLWKSTIENLVPETRPNAAHLGEERLVCILRHLSKSTRYDFHSRRLTLRITSGARHVSSARSLVHALLGSFSRHPTAVTARF
jgi:hypothetical protein